MNGADTGMLDVRELMVRYGETVAVDRASLRVEFGEIAALVGPSGCGKTSLLRAVAGFEQPCGGEVRIDGKPMSGNGRSIAPECRQVGMVFQEGALFPHLNVLENVNYGVAGRSAGRQRVAEVLERAGLTRLAERFPDQLSGGQQQLVALARALAPSPKIVLLDEPFANLDATRRQHLRTEVREILRAARMTAVLVTHDQEEALSLADRVAVMMDGRILQAGRPDEIYHAPRRAEVAEFIGGGKLYPGRVEGGRFGSPFGSVSTDAADGAARLLVRPEDLSIVGPQAAQGVPGTLGEGSFFGHDRLQTVRVDGGPSVEVRLLSSTPVEPGARVRVRLRRKTYRLFGDDGSTYSAAVAAHDELTPGR